MTFSQVNVPILADAREGTQLDRFVLGAVIGRGGMGLVFEAWDPLLSRAVALKLLSSADPALQLRLMQEARAQARLRHPHICPVYELGEVSNVPFIAMQRIQGGTLGDLRPHLTTEEAARILADVAGAIHAAHRADLIHRDLKPSNILVEQREDGTYHPYVVDFGLAKDVALGDRTLSWAVMGTPAFMSPEQARGEALTAASDVFSLGASLYAVLSGQPPYEGTTLAQLVTRHATGSVPRFRRLKIPVPRDLETIVLKCLEFESERRYPSAFALEEDLRRYLAGEPIVARPVGPLGRLARWARRNPVLAWTLAASLSAVTLLGVWNVRTLRQARIREQAAQRFGMEIRDAEHLLRIERMLPVHDIRPAEGRLRARMEGIAQEMTHLGPVTRGPGLYAIGRGQLALRDHARAVRTLEAAWDAGYRAPEVAHALAQARMLDVLDQTIHWRLESDRSFEQRFHQILGPAHTWMARAAGARVEHPEYTLGMLAMWERNHPEAQRHFARAFEAAPWLYEALLGIVYSRGIEGTQAVSRGQDPLASTRRFLASFGELDAMLAKAQALGGSDPSVRFHRAKLRIGRFILQQSLGIDVDEPSREALPFVEDALRIQPDSLMILETRLHLLYQRAWEANQRGTDPGAALRAQLLSQSLEAMESMTGTPVERTSAIHMLHNAWWSLAELDWRHGRDPRPALDQARRCAERSGMRDAQRLVALLLEVKHQISQSAGSPRCAPEAEALAEEQVQAAFSSWAPALSAELQMELARVEPDQAQARLTHAIRQLEAATRRNPSEVFGWTLLPAAQARLACWQLAHGKDPSRALAQAQATARKALQAFPRHHRIHAAAAEVHTARGRWLTASGGDPSPALDAARAALAASERLNPRYFETYLLQAELEHVAAEHAKDTGGDPTPFLDRAATACRRGLALKGDEPRFRQLLARGGVMKNAAPKRRVP